MTLPHLKAFKSLASRPVQRRLHNVIVLLLLCVMGAAPAMAEGRSKLLDLCKASDPEQLQTAMITGVAMGLVMGQSLGGPNRQYCPPNNGGISAGQYRLVVCKFIEANPLLSSQEDYTAVGIALLRSYPCPEAKKP